MSGFSARTFCRGMSAASNWLVSISCWASSRRSFRGLASFCVRVWGCVGFCWVEDRAEKVEAAQKAGTACLAPTLKIATAAHLEKLRRFIVRAKDLLRHWRLYPKALRTWMRRWSGALPGRCYGEREPGSGRCGIADCGQLVRECRWR